MPDSRAKFPSNLQPSVSATETQSSGPALMPCHTSFSLRAGGRMECDAEGSFSHTHAHTLDRHINIPMHLRKKPHSNEVRGSLCYSRCPLKVQTSWIRSLWFLCFHQLAFISLSSISLWCPIQARATRVIEWGRGGVLEPKQGETPGLASARCETQTHGAALSVKPEWEQEPSAVIERAFKSGNLCSRAKSVK